MKLLDNGMNRSNNRKKITVIMNMIYKYSMRHSHRLERKLININQIHIIIISQFHLILIIIMHINLIYKLNSQLKILVSNKLILTNPNNINHFQINNTNNSILILQFQLNRWLINGKTKFNNSNNNNILQFSRILE